ncbi:hypothetical protein [Anaerobranca gottschalkii]|uniref:Uncharacterized protein n=1 Tax=Anaerobranca gottschalkii DSM 13577 TaxID=1120990 RepID=A0A1H9YIW2_9FIRM|nr:hypothetical protein [Anaerobranca gottschalkii]SES69001.1 hypothetical protein SAMN03080614_100361 [Anaerobranca gottschalkii DSM 13577]
MKKIIKGFLILILMISLFGCSYKTETNNEKKYLTIDDIIMILEKGDYEIDYRDYVEVEIFESKLLFNKTTIAQVVDEEFCNIVYSTKVKNISDETIELNVVFYIPKELIERNIIISSYWFDQFIELDPGRRLFMDAGIIMKHYDRLNEEEREIFERLKNTLYFEVTVNGKKGYGKVSLDD